MKLFKLFSNYLGIGSPLLNLALKAGLKYEKVLGFCYFRRSRISRIIEHPQNIRIIEDPAICWTTYPSQKMIGGPPWISGLIRNL